MIDQDSSSASNDNNKNYNTEESPTHQDFHWINGELQGTLYGQLLETTLDVSAGIHACLQIVYASTLERTANEDADPGETAPPAVGIVHADQLMRLAIASAGLLRNEARRQVEEIEAEIETV